MMGHDSGAGTGTIQRALKALSGAKKLLEGDMLRSGKIAVCIGDDHSWVQSKKPSMKEPI